MIAAARHSLAWPSPWGPYAVALFLLVLFAIRAGSWTLAHPLVVGGAWLGHVLLFDAGTGRTVVSRSQRHVEQFAGRWFLAIAGVFLLVRLLPFLIRPGQPLGYDSGIYFQSYRFFGDALPGLPSFADGSFHQLEANVLRS